MVIYTKEVYPLEGNRLLLKLNTGEWYTFDCADLPKIPLFEKILKDTERFRSVHVNETGLVCWDRATDIDPEWMLSRLKPADTCDETIRMIIDDNI